MAADLQAVGVNAVAWPALDETTCGRLDEIGRAHV
jgi:hypothetical protein